MGAVVAGGVAVASVGCGPPRSAPPVTVMDLGLGVADGSLGAHCVLGSDCDSGFCDRTIPGGACSATCTDDSACGPGGICFEGYCYASCAGAGQCRGEGFTCFAQPGREGGFCAPDVEQFAPTAVNVGAPCQAVMECAAPEGVEAYCIPEIGYRGERTGFADGMCVATGCDADDACGPGGRCVAQGNGGLCTPACASNADCRVGYICDGAARACLPGPR